MGGFVSWFATKKNLRNIVAFSLLLALFGLGGCCLIVHPHFTSQIIACHFAFFQVFDDSLASFLWSKIIQLAIAKIFFYPMAG
jgi:cyanate permease